MATTVAPLTVSRPRPPVSGCALDSSSLSPWMLPPFFCCCRRLPSSPSFLPLLRRSTTGTADHLANSPRGAIIQASTPLPQSPRPLWPIRIPRPLVYSTNLADVDPVQLSELWEKTLKVTREPSKIMKALRHSFMFVIVLAEQENNDLGLRTRPKVVGIGRAVSDGAFIATICDVAVDPEYQKQGIGRRIVKRLVQEIKKKGGPSGFAVFPPPLARRFFWLIGFRSDRKYRLMGYRGKEEKVDSTANAGDESLTECPIESLTLETDLES
ncbi:hypothetical protein M758_6G003200 [Ceratodon purpureus]|nr:hypothetical protein M758_6G003200 [Ceratodon purpureus]